MGTKRYYDLKIAVPFFYGKNKFTITRKSEWSVLDLLFLRKIAELPISMEKLENYSNLKRQIVIQIVLPFVSNNWVEILPVENTYVFSITALGQYISEFDSIPQFSESYFRTRDYVFDPVGSRYYGLLKNNPLKVESYLRIQELMEDGIRIKVMNISNKSYIPNTEEIKKCVAYFDEHVEDVEFINGNISLNETRYILLDTVLDTKKKNIEFNEDYSNFLTVELLNAVKHKFNFLVDQVLEDLENNKEKNIISSADSNINQFILSSKEPLLNFYKIPAENIKTIYGGLDHRQSLLNLIRNSTKYLIIHSTFISERALYNKNLDKWSEITLELKEALKRGVEITILFGKDKPDPDDLAEDEDEKVKNRLVKSLDEIYKIENLFDKFNEECILENITPLQLNDHKKTGSHSKYIITHHSEWGPTVLIGSCNFFYSNFDRFEASVIINSNQIVHDFLKISSILCSAKDFHSNDLYNYFSDLAKETLLRNQEFDNSSRFVNLAIVFKNQHYSLIDKAKVNARKLILITSDKLSNISRKPVFEAIKNNQNAKKTVFFSEKSEIFTHKDELELRKLLKQAEYKIDIQLHTPKTNPRKKNHSKVLAWDKDDIVITSLNWLSSNASPNNAADPYHEIGIYIQADSIAEDFQIAFQDSLK
ncbi:phospholipase D-like domain-containing protein [Acinetobacter pittii]|uniref:phospholipase D-like domain-containing protein n=1 Tax=Acinetobacter pittii TaxID=48296 RepID=UPI002A699FF1|nr:phospholipase D-like domain-containing protein [Acinetobacter pittii]WPP55159.1 phospholipase D-like domain-containing protein [Acinetobacter pittii]